MTSESQRAIFEQAANDLVGHRIVGIRYCVHKRATDTLGTSWRFGPRLHTVDFGLELALETEKNISITWSNEFSVSFGLSILQGSLSSDLHDSAVWNVTQDEAWSFAINRPIRSVKVYWSWSQVLDKPATRLYFPLDLEISLDEDTRIFIGAYLFKNDDTLFSGGDMIFVFFGSEIAQHYYVGSYGNPDRA